MAKQKRKRTERVQAGLFDTPVDIRVTPPVDIVRQEVEVKVAEYRPRIVIGLTNSCPVCGERIVVRPAGGVRCLKCWWFQLLFQK